MAPIEVNTCAKCLKKVNFRITKSIYCEGECKKLFHKKCTDLSDTKYDDIISSNTDTAWFCDICKKKRDQRRSILNTNNINATIQSPRTPCTPNALPIEQTVSETISLSDIYKKLENIQTTIKQMQSEMTYYKETVKTLTQQNISLRNDNDKLKARIQNTEYQVESIKQQQLQNNILLCGIPETENEDLSIIVKNITNTLSITLNTDEITTIHRKTISGTKSAGLPAPILVKFTNTQIKNDIMNAKKGKQLDTTILATKTIKRPIYINEHLTRHRQYIFKNTRDLRREKKIEYTWTKNGDIYIRQKSDSPAVKIKNIEQLNAFTTSQL